MAGGVGGQTMYTNVSKCKTIKFFKKVRKIKLNSMKEKQMGLFH
jgi:hypothetical protein